MEKTVVFLALLASFTGPAESASHIHKRSDAVSLEAVATDVRNLANQVTSLTAQMTALYNQVTSLNRLQHIVGFYAQGTGDHFHPVQALPGSTLVLNAVLTNVGNGYDGDTGFFTAPVGGLYQFHVNFMGHPANLTYVHASLVVDGQSVATTISDSRTGYYDSVGMHPVVHVRTGAKVHVINPDTVLDSYYTGAFLTFAGFLIAAD